jgi:hypothetical protein
MPVCAFSSFRTHHGFCPSTFPLFFPFLRALGPCARSLVPQRARDGSEVPHGGGEGGSGVLPDAGGVRGSDSVRGVDTRRGGAVRPLPDRPSRGVGGSVPSGPGDVLVQDADPDGERAAAEAEEGQAPRVPRGVRGLHADPGPERDALAGVRRAEIGPAVALRLRRERRRIRRRVQRQAVARHREDDRLRGRRPERGLRPAPALPEVAARVREAQEAPGEPLAHGQGQGGGCDEARARGGAETRKGGGQGGGRARGGDGRGDLREGGGRPRGSLRARQRRGSPAQASQARAGARDPERAIPDLFFFFSRGPTRSSVSRASPPRPPRAPPSARRTAAIAGPARRATLRPARARARDPASSRVFDPPPAFETHPLPDRLTVNPALRARFSFFAPQPPRRVSRRWPCRRRRR